MRDLFLKAARGDRTKRPPVWMMRQAGRYLPEYRRLRSEYSFYEAITTPDIAEKISLLPWKEFKPDGIVMYSDILTAIELLGFEYHIEPGIGPVIENPVRSPDDALRTRFDIAETLPYVGELLERLQSRLNGEAAVIGFVGGPFTLAAYLLESRTGKTFMKLRSFRAMYPTAFEHLLDSLTAVLTEFVEYQVEHGADVIQLFDTYAGLLTPHDYRSILLPLHQKILGSVDVPTIIFVRNMGGNLTLLAESGATVIGLDWTVDMTAARDRLGDRPVQGNLDPSYLYGSKAFIEKHTRTVIEAAGDSGHILNLGHGVDKNTPVEGVRTFFETAKSIDRAL